MKNVEIYDKIRTLSNAKGFSINTLEKEAGLSRGTIGKWRNSQPTIANLQKVLEILCIPIWQFFKE